MARPLLDAPCQGWQRDLPGPNDLPGKLEVMGEPPNHVDEVYLEFPRPTMLWRGVLILLGIALLIMMLYLFPWALILDSRSGYAHDGGFWLVALFAAVFGGGWSAALIKMDIAPPLDEPIRFNRLRRKVYVYRFHYNWGRPFNNKLWYVKPEVYDWDDLRAEVFSIYVPTMAYNTGVYITVVKPGTNEVIDRFPLALDAYDGANYWAMARAFMQQGPDVLPKYDRPPRDWNNEDPGLNLARRFAPKVKWPEDMDIESRTAP